MNYYNKIFKNFKYKFYNYIKIFIFIYLKIKMSWILFIFSLTIIILMNKSFSIILWHFSSFINLIIAHLMLLSINSIAWLIFSTLFTINLFWRLFLILINIIFFKRLISYLIHSKFAITCIITRPFRHFKIWRITTPWWIRRFFMMNLWIDISLMIILLRLLWMTSIWLISLILRRFFKEMTTSVICLNSSFILWSLNLSIFSWLIIKVRFKIFVGYSRRTFVFPIINIFRRHCIHIIIIIIFVVLIHFFVIFTVSNFFVG